MAQPETILHTRSDGFTENSDGWIAVKMTTSGRKEEGGVNVFDFHACLTCEMLTVRWHEDDKAQLFPAEISAIVLEKGWAVMPSAEEIDWLEAKLAEVAELNAAADEGEDTVDGAQGGTQAPEGAPAGTTAPATPTTPPAAPTPPQAPENAPAAPPAPTAPTKPAESKAASTAGK